MITVEVPADGDDWPSTDFIVANNQTLDLRFTLTQGGQPINLTGQSLQAQFRTSETDANVALDLSTAKLSLVILDAPGGVYQMSVAASVLAGLEAGALVYDVIASVTNDPRRYRYQRGTMTVLQGVTR